MSSVVLYHLGLPLVRGGFVGVDIFFVISGFLITGRIVRSLETSSFSFREFYLARVRRILPAMIVTTLASICVASFLMAPGALQALASSAISAVASVSNIYFWLDSGYFAADNTTRVLLHTWSLGVEEQFYLIWPLLLVGIGAINRKWFLIAVIVASGTSLVAAEAALTYTPSSAFYLMPFRIFEFGLGASLVWFKGPTRTPTIVVELGAALGLGLMIGAVFLVEETMRFPGALALVPCGGAALLIAFGARSRVGRRVLANRPAIGIGRISYSLYLVHWPIVVLGEYALERRFTSPEALLALLICVALGYASWRWVEEPFRQKSAGAFLVGSRQLLTVVAVGATLTVLIAWNASSTGWIWRLGDRAVLFEGLSDPRAFHTAYFGGAKCRIPRCETNPGAPKTAYLIGDSHARAFYAGLKVAFPNVNFVIYGPNACPMYTLRMSHYDEYTAACVLAREKAISELRNAKGPVFMAHHWAARMASPHRVAPDDQPREIVDYPAFADFVLGEVGQIEELIGRQVIFLGGVPRYGGLSSPFDCQGRPFLSVDCTTSKRQGYVAEQFSFVLAMRARNVAVIDPYEALCDELSCKNVDGAGRTIYSDRTHLSVWGSRYLVRRLKSTFSRYLNQAIS